MMNPLSWAAKRIRLTDNRFWGYWFGLSTWANRSAGPNDALKLSAWWRGVKLYADVTGALPFKVYERVGPEDRREATDHEVNTLTSFDPNADDTTQEFWGLQAAQLVAGGNAYAEKRYIGSRLVALQPMPPDTHPHRDQIGAPLKYRFNDRGRYEDLPGAMVLHTRGFRFGGDLGLSALAYARETIGGSLATEEAAARMYAQGLRASGMFTGPIETSTQAADFKKNYVEPFEGAKGEGGSLILPPGFDFKGINLSAKDAELIMSRKFNVEDIARFLGIPPVLLGHASEGQTMFGTGVQNIILAWLALGLDGHLTTIEKSVNKRLFRPGDRRRFYAEFDRNALMRADSAARAEFISRMISAAQMTPNEGRRKDNRPPLPGGDQLFINSTNIPIHLAGQPRALLTPPAEQQKSEAI
jgi:HK97 family phage portal protein